MDPGTTRTGLFTLAFAFLVVEGARAELRGYRNDFSTPATLENVDPQTGGASTPAEHATCAFAPPQVVFSVGFLGGIELHSDMMLGVEQSGGSTFLVKIPREGCAIGARLGAIAIGFPNLESLASCDGTLYSASFVFASHVGQLVGIDAATGAGVAIGAALPFDVRVTGLACDPDDGLLWAVTSGFGARPAELWRIHPTTATATLVGPLGLPPNSVESLALLGGRLLGAGAKLHELDRTTGAATLVGGDWAGTLWGLATIPPPCLPISPDGDGDGVPDCADECPEDGSKAVPGACGCGVIEDASDADGDSVIACLDNCAGESNPAQTDSDADGAGDACDACVAFWTSPGDVDLPCSGAWGDTATQGAPDGLVSVTDLVQLIVFLAGPPVDAAILSRLDVAPATIGPGEPPVARPNLVLPRVLDFADLELLLDAALGRLEFAAPA